MLGTRPHGRSRSRNDPTAVSGFLKLVTKASALGHRARLEEKGSEETSLLFAPPKAARVSAPHLHQWLLLLREPFGAQGPRGRAVKCRAARMEQLLRELLIKTQCLKWLWWSSRAVKSNGRKGRRVA